MISALIIFMPVLTSYAADKASSSRNKKASKQQIRKTKKEIKAISRKRKAAKRKKGKARKSLLSWLTKDNANAPDVKFSKDANNWPKFK